MTTSFLSAISIGSVQYELRQAIEGFILLFLTPLYSRRLHDSGFSGWWSAIIPGAVGFKWWELWRESQGFEALAGSDLAWQVASAFLVIAFYGLWFWVPQYGKNRFGPDPRLAEQD